VVIDAGPKNTTNEDALPSEGRSLLTKPLTEPTLLEMSGYRALAWYPRPTQTIRSCFGGIGFHY